MLFKSKRNLGTTLDVGEVNALIRYATEKKKDKGGEIIPVLEEAKSEWEKNKDDPQKYNTMLKTYVTLCAKTSPVSGRVLLDSEFSGRYLSWLVIVTIVLILFAAAEGVLKLALLDLPTQDSFTLFSLQGAQLVLSYMNPFVWGALGACVYLLKHLYDLASHQLFDAVLFRGWWVRLVLGAVLGGVVTQIFNFNSDEAMAVAELSKTAIAFLTGLGVRVVYGAFERAVQILAEKMNLGKMPVERSQAAVSDARSVLAEELAKTNPETAPEKHKLLLEILATLGGQKDAKQEGNG